MRTAVCTLLLGATAGCSVLSREEPMDQGKAAQDPRPRCQGTPGLSELLDGLSHCTTLDSMYGLEHDSRRYDLDALPLLWSAYEASDPIKAAFVDACDLSDELAPQLASRLAPILLAAAVLKPNLALDTTNARRVRAYLVRESSALVRTFLWKTLLSGREGRAEVDILIQQLWDRGRTADNAPNDIGALAWVRLQAVTGNRSLKEDGELFQGADGKAALAKAWVEVKRRWDTWWFENREYTELSRDKRLVLGEMRRILVVNERAKRELRAVEDRH